MKLHPEKKPFRLLSKSAGVATYEADFWEGPTEAGGECGYYTKRATVSAVDAHRTVSPSVSYWPQLKAALGL